MPIGPGRYDDICTEVRDRTHASGAIIIIVGGNRGYGFSCQATVEVTLRLPEILESIARQMRESFSKGKL